MPEAITWFGKKESFKRAIICDMDKSETKTCCICGKEIEGYGYNPYPVREEGQCCRRCNYEVVVPERYRRHLEYQKTKDNG